MLTAPSAAPSPTSTAVRPFLAVVQVSLTDEEQLAALASTLVSLHVTQPGAPIVVAAGDDSRPVLLEQVAAVTEELGAELLCAPGNVVAAVNAVLNAAAEEGVDALLLAQDVELDGSAWLDRLYARRDVAGRPAAIAGGRLVLPGDVLASAGLYFSLLLRQWLPRLRYAPHDLPAALRPCSCPVAADFQLVRFETLREVGVLDEELTPADANVDFALRAFAMGLESIYEPSAVARCLTPAAPAEDPKPGELARIQHSGRALRAKHRNVDFSPWTPVIL